MINALHNRIGRGCDYRHTVVKTHSTTYDDYLQKRKVASSKVQTTNYSTQCGINCLPIVKNSIKTYESYLNSIKTKTNITYNPLFNPINTATLLTVSGPSKISYNWSLTTNNVGTYKIYGPGDYYLVINGILSPYYNITCNCNKPNTGNFIYINGINTIEIFTNDSIVAQFVATSTLYTSTSWTNAVINDFIRSDTPKSNNISIYANTSSITTGTLTPIKGGVTTIKYSKKTSDSVAQNFGFTYNKISTYFYNIYNLNSILLTNKYISSNIYIQSGSYNSNTGNKIVGYFCPPSTGTWTFNLVADDYALFTIGVSSSLPSSIIPTLSNSPSSSQCAAWWSSSQTFPTSYSINNVIVNNITTLITFNNQAKVTLTQGLYYPILLYFGQDGGGISLFLNITCTDTNITYTQGTKAYSDLFYYLSSYPSY